MRVPQSFIRRRRQWASGLVVFGFAAALSAICGLFEGGSVNSLVGSRSREANETLRVRALIPPTSADPLLYDNFVHHLAFTSVLSGLVNQYRKGEIRPQIAERWTVSPDGLEYKFWIRKDLKFSDGTDITGEVVAANLRRVAYVKQERGSQSGVLEFLMGFGSIRSADDRSFPGISSTSGAGGATDTVTLKLTQPISDFLEKLSFGFYSIAHPSSFDPKSGKWLEDMNLISSGPYRIASWTNELLTLELRSDSNYEIHPRAYQTIEISNTRDPEVAFSMDVYMAAEDALIAPMSHVFHGPVVSNISYIRCDPFGDANSPCRDRRQRIAMRNAVYQEAERRGHKITRSFFPLPLKGITELQDPEVDTTNSIPSPPDAPPPRELILPLFPPPMKSPEKRHLKHSFETLFEATEAALKNLDIPYRVRPYNLAGEETFKYDIMFWITGVRVDAPLADIRFMFLSKEGIQLPDETGEIKELVQSENFEPQRVNELLWEQGLIWPVDHTTQGLWVSPKVDMSMVATHLPPTAFEFIGAKE